MYRGVFSPFDTIYVGGGTPSALAPERLARVLAGIRGELDIAEGAGLHLEVDPEDVEPEHVREWVAMGVVFASVGVQSLHDDALGFLGRRHTAADGKRAVSLLLEAGVTTVSADLIFGLPGQTATQWRQQLESVVELGVAHVSCYQLTIHDGTAFAKRREAGQLEEMAEDEQADLYLLAHEVLGDAGFEAYEVSNFARAGHRSRHNSKYWTGRALPGSRPGGPLVRRSKAALVERAQAESVARPGGRRRPAGRRERRPRRARVGVRGRHARFATRRWCRLWRGGAAVGRRGRPFELAAPAAIRRPGVTRHRGPPSAADSARDGGRRRPCARGRPGGNRSRRRPRRLTGRLRNMKWNGGRG